MSAVTKTSWSRPSSKSSSHSDSSRTTQTGILNKILSTYIVILDRERSQSNQFPLNIISMMLRFIMFFVFRFIIVMNLTIDTGETSLVHTIIYIIKEFNLVLNLSASQRIIFTGEETMDLFIVYGS